MKIFPVRLFVLPLLLLTSCESPRLVFPDIDYGVMIESSDLPLFMDESLDSLSLVLPGDRVKATDSIVSLYSKASALRFSVNSTIKEMIAAEVETGDETIIRLTDHFILGPGSTRAIKVKTILEYASGNPRMINWREKK